MDQGSYDGFSAAGEDAVAPASKRGKARDSLLLVADLRIAGSPDTHHVRVRNLSSGGLMAEFDQAVAIGTAVRIDLRGVGKVDGEVAWTAEGRIGISLERAIDPMAARKPVAAVKAGPVKDRPIRPILK